MRETPAVIYVGYQTKSIKTTSLSHLLRLLSMLINLPLHKVCLLQQLFLVKLQLTNHFGMWLSLLQIRQPENMALKAQPDNNLVDSDKGFALPNRTTKLDLLTAIPPSYLYEHWPAQTLYRANPRKDVSGAFVPHGIDKTSSKHSQPGRSERPRCS